MLQHFRITGSVHEAQSGGEIVRGQEPGFARSPLGVGFACQRLGLHAGIVKGAVCRFEIAGLQAGEDRERLPRISAAIIRGAQRNLGVKAEVRVGKSRSSDASH